jgi:hypothetical protein
MASHDNDLSAATSTSSMGVACDDSFAASTDDVACDVVVAKSKSKMFFNFGGKKEKLKDIL